MAVLPFERPRPLVEKCTTCGGPMLACECTGIENRQPLRDPAPLMPADPRDRPLVQRAREGWAQNVAKAIGDVYNAEDALVRAGADPAAPQAGEAYDAHLRRLAKLSTIRQELEGLLL